MTLACDLDLGHRNQNFMHDILSYLSWPFCEIWLNLLWLVIVTLNLGNGIQSFVHDTPSYFVLPFSEIWLNLLALSEILWKHYMYDCDLDLGRWNLNFVLDTPFHCALVLCDIWLNSLQLFWVDVDTDLRLWAWPWFRKPKFCVWHTISFCFTSVKFDLIPFICFWVVTDGRCNFNMPPKVPLGA